MLHFYLVLPGLIIIFVRFWWCLESSISSTSKETILRAGRAVWIAGIQVPTNDYEMKLNDLFISTHNLLRSRLRVWEAALYFQVVSWFIRESRMQLLLGESWILKQEDDEQVFTEKWNKKDILITIVIWKRPDLYQGRYPRSLQLQVPHIKPGRKPFPFCPTTSTSLWSTCHTGLLCHYKCDKRVCFLTTYYVPIRNSY